MTPNGFVPVAMFGWPIISLFFFAVMRPRRAILFSIMGGWLFLPQFGYQFSGLPDYTRYTAVLVGTLAGVVLFDFKRIAQYRFRWFDLIPLIWCGCSLPTSLTNGLGLYDGLSGVFRQCSVFGAPYLLGRLYFSDRDGIRELALAFVFAVLVYIPFCLIEMRLSPQFHNWVYGSHASSFTTVWRLGGYRPRVFLRSGIETGMLMAAAAIISFWLWRARSVRSALLIPIAVTTGIVTVALLLSRALNGYGLYVAGMGATTVIRWLRLPIVVAALVLMPAGYIGLRIFTGWEAQLLTDFAAEVDADRAASLRSRIAHEVKLIEHAWERPTFGWGGYSRNRPEFFDNDAPSGAMGNDYVTDSLWIVSFGKYGLVGLLSIGGLLILPPCLLALRLRGNQWLTPANAPAGALAIVLGMFLIDCLFNSMLNPVYFITAGALLGFAGSLRKMPRVVRHQ